MILDALQQFSSAQALTGTADSTNILDYGIINGIPSSANGGGARDMGVGDPALKLFISAAAAFQGPAGSTIQVQVQFAPDNGAGAPGAWSIAESGPVVSAAAFNAGARLFQGDFPRPAPGAPIPRYMKLTYVVGGGPFTSGAVNAYIVLDRPDRPEGPSGALSGYQAGINIQN